MTPELEQARIQVEQFFDNDKDKAALWFRTPNPLLGEVSPDFMIAMGKTDRLVSFIQEQLDLNILEHDDE